MNKLKYYKGDKTVTVNVTQSKENVLSLHQQYPSKRTADNAMYKRGYTRTKPKKWKENSHV